MINIMAYRTTYFELEWAHRLHSYEMRYYEMWEAPQLAFCFKQRNTVINERPADETSLQSLQTEAKSTYQKDNNTGVKQHPGM